MANRVIQSQGKTAKVRNGDIAPDLLNLLSAVGEELDVYFEVTSGGQKERSPFTKKGVDYTGSTRHDKGNAADTKAFVLNADGSRRYLDFTNADDRAVWERIVQLSVAGGATGIGAGTGYMGSKTVHIGYGPAGTWGEGGKGANAPGWLKDAFSLGRKTPPMNIPDVATSLDVQGAPIPASLTRGVDQARMRFAANVANTPLPRPRPSGLAEALMGGSEALGSGSGGLAGALAANGAPIPATMSDRVSDLRQVASAFPNSVGVMPGVRPSRDEVSAMYGGTMAPLRPFLPGEQIDNGDGTYSTEISTTLQLPDGQFVNVPSLWMGPDGPVRFDPSDEQGILGAMAAFEQTNGPTFPRFPDVRSAVSAAEARSAAGGAGALPVEQAVARSGLGRLNAAAAGVASPAALSVTPRLPDGVDFTQPFTVTPSLRAALTGAVPAMDQSSAQARSVVTSGGLGALLGAGAVSPSAVPSSGRGVVDRSSGGSSGSRSFMDPVGGGATLAELQQFVGQTPGRFNTGQGVAGKVALPADVRPSILPPATGSIPPPWTPAGGTRTAVKPATEAVLAATKTAPPPTLAAPGAGLTAAQRNAMSSLAGTGLSTVSPATAAVKANTSNPVLVAGAMAAAAGAGKVAAPAPAVVPPIPLPASARPQVAALPAPIPMPAAARPQAVPAPVPQPYGAGQVARTNALPDLVQGRNGYWYQPQLDGTYASMRTTDEALARARAGKTGVLSQLDVTPPGGVPAATPGGTTNVTASMTANPFFKPTLGGAVQNWFDSTLIGRGLNLVQGKPQAPLGGGGLLSFVLGPQKTATGGLFGGGGGGGGLLGAIPQPSTSNRQYTAAGLAQGNAIRNSARPVYSVSGDDMRFMPTSVQNSERWLTGY